MRIVHEALFQRHHASSARGAFVAAACAQLVLLGSSAAPAQPAAGYPAPPAFVDASRLTKLRSSFAAVDQVFRDFASRGRVPGAAWGVIVDGQLVHSGATGVRDLQSEAQVDANTVFRIASMTKSFTALAILKLRDEGKLALDDPAERYVPELKALRPATSDAPRISIRQLMTHSAGFPEDNPWGDQQLSATDDDLTKMLRDGIPFSNPSGLTYEYSNLGFAILGRIVSRASGRPYNDYIAAAILKPLAMTSTTMEPAAVPRDRIALGYRWEDERWKDEPLLPDGSFGAMGGMLTSVADLSRYVGALLQAWPPRDGADEGPVLRASMREMQQIHRFSGATASRDAAGSISLNAGGYGYGLRVTQTCSFRHLVGHGGGLPGFGSLMQWLPEHGVGIVAMGNLTYTGWSGAFTTAFALMEKSGGLEPRVPQASAALVGLRDDVSRLVIRWDDKLANRVAAMNLYRDVSRERRRAAIESLRTAVGGCTLPASFEYVENALRGRWIMRCERGRLRVAITLAPTSPPRVQSWTVRQVSEAETAATGGACTAR